MTGVIGIKLKDKVVIITGVASEQGFGKAIADEFAREGAKLGISDLKRKAW